MGNCSQVNNTTILGTSAVTYDGTPLPCTDVNTCDGLNTILAKFDAIICDATNSVDILTEDITNLTEDLMIIIDDVININNQLNICCRFPSVYDCLCLQIIAYEVAIMLTWPMIVL